MINQEQNNEYKELNKIKNNIEVLNTLKNIFKTTLISLIILFLISLIPVLNISNILISYILSINIIASIITKKILSYNNTKLQLINIYITDQTYKKKLTKIKDNLTKKISLSNQIYSIVMENNNNDKFKQYLKKKIHLKNTNIFTNPNQTENNLIEQKKYLEIEKYIYELKQSKENKKKYILSSIEIILLILSILNIIKIPLITTTIFILIITKHLNQLIWKEHSKQSDINISLHNDVLTLYNEAYNLEQTLIETNNKIKELLQQNNNYKYQELNNPELIQEKPYIKIRSN